MGNGQAAPVKGLFITDFDGTLLRDDDTFSDHDLAAIANLSEQGIKTAIATGRSMYSFDRSPGADLPVDYVIFSSGAGVVEQRSRQLLYQKNLSAKMVQDALTFMHGEKLDFMLHHPVPDNHQYAYCRLNGSNVDFENRISKYREFGEPFERACEQVTGEAAQLIAIVPPENAEKSLRSAKTGLPGLSVVRATSPLDHKSTWIEVFHPGVSKSQTSAWLASSLDIPHADTMAIGNDYNDQDLLHWAACSFVMDNAPLDLKPGLTTVASNNHGGVAEAVERWMDLRGQGSAT